MSRTSTKSAGWPSNSIKELLTSTSSVDPSFIPSLSSTNGDNDSPDVLLPSLSAICWTASGPPAAIIDKTTCLVPPSLSRISDTSSREYPTIFIILSLMNKTLKLASRMTMPSFMFSATTSYLSWDLLSSSSASFRSVTSRMIAWIMDISLSLHIRDR